MVLPSTNQWTDEEILRQICSEGREKALYLVFEKLAWRQAVIAFVVQHGGNEHDGEDAAQETLVNFDRNIRLGAFKGDSALKTYFMAIAKFHWYNKLRSRRPLEELKPQHRMAVSESVEDHAIAEEKKRYLDEALGRIGARCKEILRLAGLDYSMDEIAQKVGLSSAAMAKKEAYRCRLRFRDFLEANPGWKELLVNE
ncbi:MAG: sigma-70 family RNA polymerase sigma factor [Lewinellaceae bacterium]|nr:sigma-70 family RNA polymerase sigma factor [Lewinellaceae bacterium]